MKKHYCLVFLIILFCISNSLAQQKQDSLKVFFVGNSYTFVSNMPHLVSLISDKTKTKLITSKSTLGGSKLSNHWRSEKGLNTKELIKNGNFDIVVLQDFSTNAIKQPDSLLTYVKKFSDFIKANGAKPYLYATWARKKVPKTQEIITNVYKKAAIQNDIGIVYVGETWALARKSSRKKKLYHSDGSHPTQLGAFLTACAFVKEFSQELPKKLSKYYKITDSFGEFVEVVHLDESDINFCAKVVRKITKK